ncbi:MAG: endonuclease V [Cytophagia bacterium]|nr:endonuclease V [Cytophagia bacterium]
MILAFDTYYFDNKAKTVCIAFNDWSGTSTDKVYTEITEGVEAYQPGEFYKRELPCILSLLKKMDTDQVEAIVIDGYVYLDDNGQLGLGGHLYHRLHSKIPIIGVAKTNFKTIDKHKEIIVRGKSVRPLYITAVGIDIILAAKFIQQMAGEHRIPSLLKKLDTLTRE